MVAVAKVLALVAPTVEAMGYECWGGEYHPAGKHSVLRIYIERPDGITLDDCTVVSKQLSAILDVENLVAGEYQLEVSSPGLDRPLFKPRHYQAFIGHEAKVRLAVADDSGRRQFTGRIVAADDERLVLEADDKTWSWPFSQIEKGQLLLT